MNERMNESNIFENRQTHGRTDKAYRCMNASKNETKQIEGSDFVTGVLFSAQLTERNSGAESNFTACECRRRQTNLFPWFL